MRRFEYLKRMEKNTGSILWRIGIALLLGLTFPHASMADPAITPGSADKARNYYTNLAAIFKGFEAKPGVTTIDDLLLFAGYSIAGDALESSDPALLMEPEAVSTNGLGFPLTSLNAARLRGGDILAARFFAPKIVNISAAIPTPGWRKLVRFRVRPDSLAARAGAESLIVLFNFLVPATNQPFSGHSFNTQAMLLAPSLPDRLYWLDFDDKKILTLALNASFDAADLQSAGNHDYFVPDGCNACHGSPGNSAKPMVNYLDTDHWFDRLGDNDDFKQLKDAGTPLLFDAQTNDPSQALFARAFDVIRRFNEEALLQNVLAQPNSFETEAARTWLKLHTQSNDHIPPVERAFSISGGAKWQSSEAEGLGKLNRYCFRCHGSVYFSVYDRSNVLAKAGNLMQRIIPGKQQINRPGFKMPPDRNLDPAEAQRIYDFLNTLK